MTSPLQEEGERIVRALSDAGHQAYFAGGCVRDMVMDIEPHDVDVATGATPEQVTALFPRALTVGAQFGVVVVPTALGNIEVATFRADSPYSDGRHPDAVSFCSAREDVMRRDFTINGMLYDPAAGEVLDWVGGRDDIRNRVLRAIGDPNHRFAEDKLRMLRAIRFAARFDYAVEDHTYNAICRRAREIDQVSMERIREELVKTFSGPHAGRALRLMHDVGLISVILPEVDALAGCEQPPQFHPEGDVLEHTCMMLDILDATSPELAMGTLLHDVGKPQTRTIAERIRFDEHDRVGETMTRDICTRLRFSNDAIDQISGLVGSHMRFMAVKKMRLSRLKRLLGLPRFEEHLELHRVDCAASHGKLDNYHFLRDKLEELGRERIAPAPLATGHDLIAMGYEAGPRFREILDGLREEQLDERITTPEQALAWIRQNFPKT